MSGWTVASRTPGCTPPSDTSPACARNPSLLADAASTGGTWSASIVTSTGKLHYIRPESSVSIQFTTAATSAAHSSHEITLVFNNVVCSTQQSEEQKQFIRSRMWTDCQFGCVCVGGGLYVDPQAERNSGHLTNMRKMINQWKHLVTKQQARWDRDIFI